MHRSLVSDQLIIGERRDEAEFRVGPVLGDRVLVLQGGDLMAIDLATSETLWRNSMAPQNGVDCRRRQSGSGRFAEHQNGGVL